MNKLIYLDHAATTPVDPRVLQVMLPYFTEKFGNPSSTHWAGQQAEAAVETAREISAAVLHCSPEEVIFTSGGSESDNLAFRGVALARRAASGANKIVTSRVEHPAVSRTARQLEKYSGFEIVWLECDSDGKVAAEDVGKVIGRDTAIVSLMYANNEIGTINDIKTMAAICHEAGVPFHTDAVQAAAYLNLNVEALGVDLLSLGAHKFHGPKGVGGLYVRKCTPILPIQTGGSQENGWRAGTQNTAYITGFAEALRITTEERELRTKLVKPLRDRIIGTILEEIPAAKLTGHPSDRLPNHCSFVFKEVDGNLLLTYLDAHGFACSSGSACKTGNPEPSEVLLALGLSAEWALGSLRVTLGKDSTAMQVDSFLETLPGLVEKARMSKTR